MPRWIECLISPFSNLLVVVMSGRVDLPWMSLTRSQMKPFQTINSDSSGDWSRLSCKWLHITMQRHRSSDSECKTHTHTRRTVPLSHAHKSRLGEVLTEILVVSALDHHFQQRSNLQRNTVFHVSSGRRYWKVFLPRTVFGTKSGKP